MLDLAGGREGPGTTTGGCDRRTEQGDIGNRRGRRRGRGWDQQPQLEMEGRRRGGNR
jgi:hypothetical protein